MFNPFRELCVEEHFTHEGDIEALRLIEDAWDEDIYIDLREFQITTKDY